MIMGVEDLTVYTHYTLRNKAGNLAKLLNAKVIYKI